MVTISACLIVKNEEEVLSRALSSVKSGVDEIIVVDTGSVDGTKAVAAQFTDKVYDFEWVQDFAAARNFCAQKATCDYFMWLDADDVIDENALRRLKRLKATLDKSVDIVMTPYVVKSEPNGKPTFSYYRERIIKCGAGHVWKGRVHEVIEPNGKIIYENIPVRHAKLSVKAGDSDRNLKIYEYAVSIGESLDARSQYYYARELYYHGRFEDAAAQFHAVLEGNGWYVNKIDACLLLSRIYSSRGQYERARRVLVQSFVYDLPNGEVCHALGDNYFVLGDYRRAIYWYSRAASLKPNAKSGSFIDYDCYGFLPLLQLCVCYDRLGNHKTAFKYHTRVKKLRPNHPSVRSNEEYFGRLGFKA